MIGSTRAVVVWAYRAATDMRKGFDGLSALVSQGLGRDPLGGEMFVFVSRDRKRSKVLFWDGTGLCVYAKRLERGRFASLWRAPADEALRLTMNELQLFLEGSVYVGRVALSPPVFDRRRMGSDGGCGVSRAMTRRSTGSWTAGARSRRPRCWASTGGS